MMFLVQFVCLSLIQIGVYCQPFKSLGFLRYSFGYNDFPIELPQKTINMYYSDLGIQSNFISNLNFMLFPLLLMCLILFLILRLASSFTNHYRHNPCLKIYGRSFLNQIALTVVIFNIPNICSSFVINYQSFGI